MRTLLLLMLVISSAFASNELPTDVKDAITVQGNGQGGGTDCR